MRKKRRPPRPLPKRALEPSSYRTRIAVETDPDDFLLPLAKRLPKDWFWGSAPVRGVWVSGFEVRGLGRSAFRRKEYVDLAEGRIFFESGWIEYLDISGIHTEPDRVGGAEVEGEPQTVEVFGNYAVLALPIGEDPGDGSFNDGRYRRRSEVVIALARGFMGRNVAWRQLFENCYKVPEGHAFAFSDRMQISRWYDAPDTSIRGRRALATAVAALEVLDPLDRSRLELSMRWFSQSAEANDTDRFLRLWIALETLAMERDAKIRPVVAALADAYGLAFEAAYQKFRLDLLQQVRHRVVHTGEQDRISLVLGFYLEAIYLDVLDLKLCLPCRHRAAAARDGIANNLVEYVEKQYGIT